MLIDSHSHLDVAEFDHDREDVLARAASVGVTRHIVPGIDATNWPRLKRVCASHNGLFPAYGLHPLFIDGHDDLHLAQLREWLGRERPVAVGECGLDFHVGPIDRERQTHFFDAQLKLARDFDLPVVVHARRAVDAVIAAIRRVGNLRGVVHSFAGSLQQAEMLARNDFLLGVGGPVTYPRANRLRKVVAEVPIDWLVLETDAPDQPDCRHRGERNEPERMVLVAETIATLRGTDMGEIAAATSLNTERLFRLPAIDAAPDAVAATKQDSRHAST
jgi:TatD DNase family protein